MALSDLQVIDNVVKFDTYATELGTNFNGVTIAATHSYRTASQRRDVDAVHQQIYSRLPAGTPNDPKKYTYVEVITASGESVILGIPWIKESTIQAIKTLVYKPSIVINSNQDITIINQVLTQAGYSNIIATDTVTQ